MVISVNQTDTAFYYLCDWQYKNRVHGSSQIDSTAEKYALFFMWLNNRSLGYKSFNITDSSLFLTMGSSGAKKITILEKNTDSIAANNMYTYFEECTDIYYCGTPDYCDNQPNGCDYLSGCGLCQKIYDICYSGWFDDGSTGGGENGGTGNNPPGIPPGNGGNAGSGGTPPDPCNGTPNNPAPFAKGNNTTESNVVPDCGGGGGWKPIPIEDEPGENAFWIANELVTPCFNSALLNLANEQPSLFFSQIYNIFDSSINMHLYFQEVDTIPGAYATEITDSTNSMGSISIITLNKNDLKKCSQEYISYVLIHEVAHAAMDVNVIEWDSTNTQHENMIIKYLDKIINSLQNAFPNMSYIDACSICYYSFNNAIDGVTPNLIFMEMMLKRLNLNLLNQNSSTVTVNQLILQGKRYCDDGDLGDRICN
ncbi:MAG: hypothetical protein IPL97_05220 [Niastella sp.]|nr:hypothetical protein [Niastella sp.]